MNTMGRMSNYFIIFKSGGTLKYKMIYTMLTDIYCPGRTLLAFKTICSYFQCAPFLRLETSKVVWVLSLAITDSDQHSFPIFLYHIDVPTFS